ncbi:hypothetical protein A3C96_00975 [Candidatus Uhrbacteria bacterium RIFCSPHIGHO2_02_FULL_60_10]|uniref:Type II secretion system protein GspG C-terminal domain-containing protein n=1 Tax=Candidatus Uhrbacteria bacterium RIFCSPHIGHO2_02_FULL_60_10 TaxID=1802392 RepID=A0A1F7U4H6_9BACT|nr:MAG: hypothetical protein A3C96_00975 [Candidatus Uhrbacteria bacterium RIFCSPHIGHO2_02_FULL_60_10]
MKNHRPGFTLIELLIVIAIIGFLAAAILVAVDPVKRIQDARNAKRWSEVNAILNAILNKQVDDRAIYDGETSAPIITDTSVNGDGFSQVIVRDDAGVVCTSNATAPFCFGQNVDYTGAKTCVANIKGIVPIWVSELPIDPKGVGQVPDTGYLPLGNKNTGYYLHRTNGNRIEIGACRPDQGAVIRVRR